MATRLPNGRWKGRIYLPNHAGEDTLTFDRRKDAEDWERVGRARLRVGEAVPNRTRQSLREFVCEHEDEVLEPLSAATRSTYKGHINLRILPTLGALEVARIKAIHVERAQSAWQRNGLSGSTAAGTRNCLSRLFKHAIKLHLVSSNPVSGAERPSDDVERVPVTLDVYEVEELARRCGDVSSLYGDYVRVAALTGLRAGELTALQVHDVDLERSILTVSRAWSRTELKTPKSGRVRQVPIVDDLVPILERRGEGGHGSDWLFSGPKGARLHHQNFRFRVHWTDLVISLGWPGFRFHDLRASAIVFWIKAGIPLSTVRALAGHQSLSTTDRYAKMARNDLAAAGLLFSSYLSRTAISETGGGGARQDVEID